MESTEKAELGKETNVWGELAKESTPSQTSRVIRFPLLCLSPVTESLAETRLEWIAIFESYTLLRETTKRLMNKEKRMDHKHKVFNWSCSVSAGFTVSSSRFYIIRLYFSARLTNTVLPPINSLPIISPEVTRAAPAGMRNNSIIELTITIFHGRKS